MIISYHGSKRVPQLAWIRDIPPEIDYVVLRGNPELTEEYVYNQETHACTLRCQDNYDGLPQKIKAGLQFVYTYFNPSYVFKIDDDVVVNIPRLLAFSHTDDDYVGRVTSNRCDSVNVSLTYCAGPIYYLSHYALAHIKDMDAQAFTSEDINVGWHAARCGIPIRNIFLYTDNINNAGEFIAYHDWNRILFPDVITNVAKPVSSPRRYKFSFMRR